MRKTKLQKVIENLHKAEEKYPNSEVAIDTETGRIIAHSRSFDKTMTTARRKAPKSTFIVGRKPPEHNYACPHIHV